MDMIGKIRRLHCRRRSLSARSARSRVCRATRCASGCKAPVDGASRSTGASEQPGKLTAFHEALKQALKADAHRPKHERRTAKALYAQIRARGYGGGYSRVTDFIRAWRQGEGQAAATNAFVPLAFELGEAFQFDWSEEGLVVGGIYYRAQVSHMKLCASRAFWLVAYPSQGHEMLFDAHTRSLRGAGRHGPARHLRQHEDGGGQGQEGQGPHRQRALRHHVRALPVRRRLLQRRHRLGEGRRREERAGQPPAHLDRRGQAALRLASPNSTPGWASAAGRCGRRCATPSTSSSAWPRCSSTSART